MLEKISADNRFAFFDFIYNGKIIENAPLCGMTLKAAGSMRFRWNETNPLRTEVLEQIAGGAQIIPVELIHSKIVIDADSFDDVKNVQADGLITKNYDLMPVITVADCMPVYLYNPIAKLFGVVHSGWKGTGIAVEAIKLAEHKYGTSAKDFCVILGPHIRNCCYIINQERADFFSTEFTPECITELEKDGTCYAGGRGLPVSWNNGNGKLYRLSLEKANLASLKKCGVLPENINIINECTCCNVLMGSNRRETAEWTSTLNGKPFTMEEAALHFTVQAAFINSRKSFSCN